MKHYSCTAIFFVALTACTSCIPCSAAETKTESQFELSYPTVGEIRKYSAEHSIYSYPVNYLEEPSFTAPYSAGRLNEASLQNGLNMLNFCRYIAGLPADVELSENYNAAAQAGQLIDCMNSYLCQVISLTIFLNLALAEITTPIFSGSVNHLLLQ